MRLILTVPCFLILNCLSSLTNSTAQAQQDDNGSPAVEPAEASAVSFDVIAVITAYTDAMLSRRIGDAAALVDSSFQPGWPSQFATSREMTNARSIQFVSVQLSETNGLALAVSQEVDISNAFPRSKRGTTACFVVDLKRNDQKWLVTRHLFAPPEVARQLIAQFQKTTADAKVIPSIHAVASGAKELENEDDIVQIYSLQHADARLLADTVNQLLSPDTVALVAESRTNSIIARGPRKGLEMIEALVLRLDLPAAKQLSGGGGVKNYSTPTASPHVDVESLTLKVKQVEELTAQIAHEVNAASGEAKDALRDRLRREVQSSFEMRQQLQRAELQNVRDQLKRIEQSIETRERIKHEIIEHRVEELLNPELPWAPSGGNVSARVTTTASGEVIELRGRREDVDNVREAIEQNHSYHKETRADSNADGPTHP